MSREWETWWERHAQQDFPRRSIWDGERKIDIPTPESPVRRIIAAEAEKSGNTVLDVGCATCIDYEFFRDRGMSYTGVDITKKFLDYARRLYPGIRLFQANAVSLPFGDESFDTAYGKSLVEHIHPKEWRAAVSEIWRVVRRKAMFCFVLVPWDKPAEYVQHEQGFWKNHLNKQEFIEELENLERFKSLVFMEKVGRHDLYIMEKE